MVQIKEVIFNKVILLSVLFIFILSISDYISMNVFYETQAWTSHHYYVMGFWIMAFAAIIGFTVIYYLFTEDWKKSIMIFTTPTLLILGGLEDLFFFVWRWGITQKIIDSSMCWFGFPINIVSKLLNESCVTPISLFLNILLFLCIIYLVNILLRGQD